MFQRIWLTLAAPDFGSLVTFYRRILGQDPQVFQDDRYAQFDLPHLSLGIFKPHPNHQDQFSHSQGSPLSLCLQVDNLPETIAFLKTLGAHVDPDVYPSSHGQEVYAYDPQGNRLILYQPTAS